MAVQVETTAQWLSGKESVMQRRQLIFRRFIRHRLGLVGAGIMLTMYILVVFAPFLAPNNYLKHNEQFTLAPPTRIRFIDEDGFHWRPFVYRMARVRDPVTLELTYNEDRTKKFPIYFFVRGDAYKFLGMTWNIHLFGIDYESDGVFYPMGTDRFGRDLLARTLHGGRVSLSVGIFGIVVSFVLGIVIGGFSGYYGGLFDNVVQRFMELLRSFPRIPLWLAMSMILPPQWSSVAVYFGVITILSLVDWTGLARVVRGQFLSLKEYEFVMASQALGASDARIVFVHIVPNITSYLIVAATLALPGMIIGESSISFLGLGIKEPMTSWGLLLKDAQTLEALSLHPWLLIPGLFIIVSVLALNFVGDALRDAFDPFSIK